MSHPEQAAFMLSAWAKYGRKFSVFRMLDCGSQNINGSCRDLFESVPCYIGADVVPGKGVDIVAAAHELTFRDDFFDLVVSGEMLEHSPHWQADLRNMARMLKSGGLMVLTCAGPGRPEHGTRRSTPADAPGLPWPDYYQNLSAHDIVFALGLDAFEPRECFSRAEFPQDTYFWGVKR